MRTTQIENCALLIVAIKMLLQVEQLLKSRDTMKASRQRRGLLDKTLIAIESIDTLALSLIADVGGQSVSPKEDQKPMAIVLSPLMTLVWPLYCASTAPGITATLRKHIKQLLQRIGEEARIPKALSLV